MSSIFWGVTRLLIDFQRTTRRYFLEDRKGFGILKLPYCCKCLPSTVMTPCPPSSLWLYRGMATCGGQNMATNLAVGGMSYLVAFPRGKCLVDRGYHGWLGLIVVPRDAVVHFSLPGDVYSHSHVYIEPESC
jgi:hypothetical protein